ncbi:hypothetical protein OC834_004810 [Tilletia horrida]|nr:hypothetical protein OC834_004810 [Tilletia horrida]KAK0533807.1 hypothetical protein OC835_002892 [Tilletia horrida]KAK0559390.1 hypothetical protein OC844_004437 [Tilletia horrida]
MFSSWIKLLSLASLAMALPVSKRGFSGTATFYDATGVGNCGGGLNPNGMVVALNTAQYGSTSSVSSHCWQTVTITNQKNGKTMTASVQDSCPTCPFGNLDMSTALFSALNNGNMDDGIFPISWSFGGSSGGNSNSNNDDGNNWTPPKSSPKPSPKPTSTYSPSRTSTSSSPASSSSAAAASPTISAPAPPSFLAPTNTTLINGTVTGTPSWWSELDTSCWEKNVTLPANVTGVVISPSKFANTTAELTAQCGKWLNATNPDNGKSILALIVSFVPGGAQDQIALSSGYPLLADMADDMPAAISNIEWGIIAGNSTTNATSTTTTTAA